MKSYEELMEITAPIFVEVFREVLDGYGAKNFVTTTVEDKGTGEKYEVTVKKPDGKTPAQMFEELTANLGKVKLKAKPKGNIMGDEDSREWLQWMLDEEGCVTGYYLKGPSGAYLVGELIEVDAEYTVLEYWVPVVESTLEVVE